MPRKPKVSKIDPEPPLPEPEVTPLTGTVRAVTEDDLREGRLRLIDRKAGSFNNLLAFVGTAIAVLTFAVLVWDRMPFRGSSSPDTLPALASSIEPVQGRLNNVHVTQGIALGDGCIQKQWDCSQFAEDDYDKLGMVVTFDLETLGTSGSTLEVIWQLMETNESTDADPVEVANGPGWPKGVFPIVTMEDSRIGTLWIPYPSLEGRFFATLQLVGLPNGQGDSINTGTFELPMVLSTSEQATPSLDTWPTIALSGGD